jgi:AcrR family transcriptional regulator
MSTVPSTRRAQIVAAARRLLEEEGPEALSMRNVAAEIGIRAPSLYEHVADKRALESAIIAAGLNEQGVAFREALAADDAGDPLAAIAEAWRRWARAHPHLYALIYARDLDRSDPAVADAELAAGAPLREIVDGDLVTARVIWAFAHGMVNLELTDRFPPGTDVEALWERGLGALRALVPPHATPSGT